MTQGISFRVVMIGDSQVGKSSLVNSFLREIFEIETKSTVGAIFNTYTSEVDGVTYIMQLWDTAGQDKYRSLGPIYYRDSVGAIAVFDVTAEDPFSGLQKWIDDFNLYASVKNIFIVGNKSDLTYNHALVLEKAANFAQDNDAKLFFTSAKTKTNVEDMFQTVFYTLVAQEREKTSNASSKIDIKDGEKASNKCC